MSFQPKAAPLRWGGLVALTCATSTLLAAEASAQTLPALRPASGLSATSAAATLERDGPRYAGPRAEASAMPPAVAPQRVAVPYRFPDEQVAIPQAYDVVFLTETRPVRVRMRTKVAEGSLVAEWKGQVRKLFDFFDRDGDGQINAYEAEFVFSNRGVQQMIAQGSATPAFSEPGRSLSDFDKDGDGRISYDEFLAYYNPSAERLVTVRPGTFNADAFAGTLTEELFKLFDRNKDGRLSKEELVGAESLLSAYDSDEDECLAALELVPDLFNRRQPPAAVQASPATTARGAAATPSSPVQVYAAGGIPETILEQLLTRYDKDKNLRLSKEESGLDDAAFARLDRNKNGELAVTELVAWREGPPDLEVELSLGSKPSESGAKVLPGPDGKAPALASALKTLEPGKALLRIGNQQIEFNTYAPTGIYARQINQAVANLNLPDGGRGYVTDKDLVGPQFQYLRVLFDTVDRDADGKMTRAEFNAYFQVQRGFQSVPLVVNYAAQVPSLFQLLDGDGDGRLSVRELRGAYARMRDLEPGGGEQITRAAIQAHGTVQFGRSVQVGAGPQQVGYNPRIVPPSRGPVWFRKMDRNADGDLSRAEFLGAADDFARMDADADGRVSLQEAEAADKTRRASSQK